MSLGAQRGSKTVTSQSQLLGYKAAHSTSLPLGGTKTGLIFVSFISFMCQWPSINYAVMASLGEKKYTKQFLGPGCADLICSVLVWLIDTRWQREVQVHGTNSDPPRRAAERFEVRCLRRWGGGVRVMTHPDLLGQSYHRKDSSGETVRSGSQIPVMYEPKCAMTQILSLCLLHPYK